MDDDLICLRLGKNIVQMRKKLKMSQEKLALDSFIDQRRLAKIEKGTANPTIKTLHKLCRVMRLKIVDLLKENH